MSRVKLGAGRRSTAFGFAACFAVASAPELTACGSEGTIGAVLGQRSDGRLFIREAPPMLAADRAGVSAGDEILLVDGRDVRTMNAAELHRVLEGDVGDPVRLTVLHGQDVRRVTLRLTPAMPNAARAGNREQEQ